MRAQVATEHRLAYSPTEAAAAVGSSRQFIYDRIADGTLKSVTHGKRRFIPRAALLAFVGADGDAD